jgi:hypothetical protein
VRTHELTQLPRFAGLEILAALEALEIFRPPRAVPGEVLALRGEPIARVAGAGVVPIGRAVEELLAAFQARRV